jgi:glutamine---fructose-6-phosphate transaminase (isomerizing)
MPVDLSVVQGQYFRDLLSQPQALSETISQLKESKQLRGFATLLRKRKFKSVLLTGMGSSLHGLNPLLLQLSEADSPVTLVETSELVYYRRNLLKPDSLVIAVSQSGRSAEVIRLLKENRRRSPIIAVTNTADSPLARSSDAVVLTRAGEEFSVSCKTYLCALAALKFLGDQLCAVPLARTAQDLNSILQPVSDYLARWKDLVEAIVPQISATRQLFLVGRGPSLATVGTGALILKESTQYPSEGLSSAAFRHGPFEMIGPQTFVLVFAGDTKTKNLNKRLFDDIRANQGRAELVAQDAGDCPYCLPKVPGSLLPILEMLPVQMLSLALGAVRGRQPGQFRLASKVTTVE